MAETHEITHLPFDNLSDFHIHPDYSIDATGSIEDFCHASLRRGLAEICFTTHFDANPRSDQTANFIRVDGQKVPTTIENLAAYVDHVQRATEEFYPYGLSVKLGVEFGWYDGCEEQAHALKHAYPFDYMLVGVHEIHDQCFCAMSTFEKCFANVPVDKAVAEYARQVIAAAKSGIFNTVAHLDYIKKYGERYYGNSVNDAFRSHLLEIFSALKSSKTAMEVNTAARRLGFASFYPSIDIINEARRAGVDVHFLGSDAHKPEQVGYEFEEVIHLVPDAVTHCED
jgi:histidinol-phosphatase (PHP family)